VDKLISLANNLAIDKDVKKLGSLMVTKHCFIARFQRKATQQTKNCETT